MSSEMPSTASELRSLAEQSNAWPFEQAKAIVASTVPVVSGARVISWSAASGAILAVPVVLVVLADRTPGTRVMRTR